jgi:tRNA threonylcarbamoyladenosine modification (KEOPS) complex Cgi121 subunit
MKNLEFNQNSNTSVNAFEEEFVYYLKKDFKLYYKCIFSHDFKERQKIDQFIIQELDSYVYLVFGGIIQDLSESIDVKGILEELEEKHKLVGSQLFDFRPIWGYKHIFSALWHAEKAKNANRMISNSFSMEILLYIAGCRQIKKALEMLGVKESTHKIIGVLVADSLDVLPVAHTDLKERIRFKPSLHIIEEFDLKREWFIQQLFEDNYQNADKFSDSDIEKAQLEKVALLALNA